MGRTTDGLAWPLRVRGVGQLTYTLPLVTENCKYFSQAIPSFLTCKGSKGPSFVCLNSFGDLGGTETGFLGNPGKWFHFQIEEEKWKS